MQQPGPSQPENVPKSFRPPRALPPPDDVGRFYFLNHPERLRNYDPACFGCGLVVDEWRELERAHLVDRCFGGLDGPQNLAMLCHRCHGAMPSFGPDDIDAAWRYIETQEPFMDRCVRLAHAEWRRRHP